MTRPALTVMTAPHPGAVAILQLHGHGARTLVQRLTGRDRFDDARVYLVRLADADEGLAVCRGEDWAQLLPHGGPRVVEKLVETVVGCGAALEPEPDPRALYPEAQSAIEADMLAVLAQSPSPAAMDLLLAQPALWRACVEQEASHVRARLRPALDHLLHPPTVVIAGPPNVGKSTLHNAMVGRSLSLVSELPGATRDWVGSLAEIGDVGCGISDFGSDDDEGRSIRHRSVAVHWIDTPGVRDSDDAVEREAIRLAAQVIERADVLILMRDPHSDYPPLAGAHLRVVNKVDGVAQDSPPGRTRADELSISALHGRNLDVLQQRILGVLGLDAIAPDTLWPFSATLRRCAAGEPMNLREYCGLPA